MSMRYRLLPLLVLTTMIAAPAMAFNMSGFQDAPITRLKGDDLKAYRAVIMKALDDGAEGTTVEWHASRTTFTGKVTPGRTFHDGSLVCREAIVDSDSGDRQMKGRYTFCKDDKKIWQLRSPSGKGK